MDTGGCTATSASPTGARNGVVRHRRGTVRHPRKHCGIRVSSRLYFRDSRPFTGPCKRLLKQFPATAANQNPLAQHAAERHSRASSIPIPLHGEHDMNRSELSAQLAAQFSLDRASADRIVAGVFAAIGDSLAKGEAVSIAGFGTFATKSRPARQGLNPGPAGPSPSPPRRHRRSSPARRFATPSMPGRGDGALEDCAAVAGGQAGVISCPVRRQISYVRAVIADASAEATAFQGARTGSDAATGKGLLGRPRDAPISTAHSGKSTTLVQLGGVPPRHTAFLQATPHPDTQRPILSRCLGGTLGRLFLCLHKVAREIPCQDKRTSM